MTYSTAALTAQTTPATSLITAIEAALTAQGGWTAIETVVIGANTFKVWRCNGATNGFGTDFFLYLGRATAGTGNVTVRLSEAWDATGKLVLRGCYGGTNTSVLDSATGSRFGATTYAIDSANWSATTLTTATAFTYWIIATKDALIVQTSSGTNIVYAGIYADNALVQAQQPTLRFPLALATFAGMSAPASSLGLTRIPGASNGSVNWNTVRGASATDAGVMGLAGSVDSASLAYPTWGAVVAAPIFLGAGNMSSSAPTSFSAILGTFKYLYAIGIGAAPVRGDTVTIGADTYILGSAVSNVGIAANTAAV